MLTLLKIVAAVLAGVFLGLMVTIHVLDGGARTVVAGPWQGAPRDGTFDVDPYTLAADERSGVLPLGVAEGLTFVARTDSDGRAFARSCDYVVAGPMPQARYWTLSLLDAAGFPIADPAERYGFTSAEVLRDVGAPVTIEVSPQARSGNWLPTGKRGSYVLMLRLYDSGLSTAGTVFEEAEMPSITRGSCS